MSYYSNLLARAVNEAQPVTVMLELTYACNLDCEFCYNDVNLEGTPLMLKDYESIFDQLNAMGGLHVTLSGGEPLAHPEFWAIGKAARERGFVVRIKSNGHALDERRARRLRDEIDPFKIELSLHGATAATHDKQTRVPGSHERLLRNIKTMQSLGLRLKINSTLTAYNEHEMEDMFALVDALGVPFRIDPEVKPKDDGDDSPLEMTASKEAIARYEAILRERAAKIRATMENRGPEVSDPGTLAPIKKHCGAGSNSVTIDPMGNVLPCVQWRETLGNVHEDSLADIWSGEVARKVRAQNEEVKRSLDADYGEFARESAFCPGLAHMVSGDPTKLYPAAKGRIERAKARVRLPLIQ